MAKLTEIHLQQILYKTNNDKLFQYKVISIEQSIVKVKSLSSGFIRSCTDLDLSSYKTIIPKTNKVAKQITVLTGLHQILN